jgi:hypothetical protein
LFATFYLDIGLKKDDIKVKNTRTVYLDLYGDEVMGDEMSRT